MNSGHLVDEGDLTAKGDKSKHLRLWGSEDDQFRLFGRDLEKEVWKWLLKDGCEFSGIIREWQHRIQLCLRLKGHWDALYAEN